MAYDLSMFNNISARNSPNLAESFSRGMDARKQMDQTNEDRAIKGALKKNMVAGPDGKTSLNREGAFADLAQINPEKAQAMERDYMKQDMEKMSFQANAAKDLAWGIRDQDTYTQARERGLKMGLPGVEKLPEQYDPGLVKQLQYSTLTAAEQLAEKKHLEDLSMRERTLAESRAERRANAGMARAEREDVRNDKLEERNIQLSTPYGMAITPDDAKQVKEGHVAKKNFDNKIQAMIDLREKHNGGTITNREDVARAKQLSKDALLEYKNMAKLGVLSVSDENIINAIIPEDPLEYNSVFSGLTGQDPILHKLKSFKADNDKNFQETIATRTRGGKPELVGQETNQRRREDTGFNLLPEAEASGQGGFSGALQKVDGMDSKDQEALVWAGKNKNDPRAQKILMNINSKYGGK